MEYTMSIISFLCIICTLLLLLSLIDDNVPIGKPIPVKYLVGAILLVLLTVVNFLVTVYVLILT